MNQNKVTYGLGLYDIVDSEWFWTEVWLRAVNNYGQWNNEAEAKNMVKTAITDICNDAKWNDIKTNFLLNESKVKINQLVADMLNED